jgi:hypothetical protein
MSQPSLLQFILDQEGSSVYGDDKNYDIADITLESALKMTAIQEFDNQAYVDNGIGFKAFILTYESKGLNVASAEGKETGGIVGGVTKALESADADTNGTVTTSTGSAALEALGQLNFLNDVRAKVWIPVLDKDIPNPQILMGAPPLMPGVSLLENRDLYQTCVIEKESLLSSLPPPGSLVVVDFQNRKTRSGLTMKHAICTDINFSRIIMGEFAGIADVGAMSTFFENLANTSATFGFATGDSMGQLLPVTPAMTPDNIAALAAEYDSPGSVPGSGYPPEVPNKSQHLSHLNNAHHEFQPYMKAFMYKVWADKRITIKLNSTYRSPSHQAQLRTDWINGGKIGPEPTTGISWHNFGMAMDFNPILENGTKIMSTDSPHAWQASGVVEAGESVNLYWGGRFRTNWDPIHFDFRNVVVYSVMKNKLLDLSIAQGVTANRVNYSAVV